MHLCIWELLWKFVTIASNTSQQTIYWCSNWMNMDVWTQSGLSENHHLTEFSTQRDIIQIQMCNTHCVYLHIPYALWHSMVMNFKWRNKNNTTLSLSLSMYSIHTSKSTIFLNGSHFHCARLYNVNKVTPCIACAEIKRKCLTRENVFSKRYGKRKIIHQWQMIIYYVCACVFSFTSWYFCR